MYKMPCKLPCIKGQHSEPTQETTKKAAQNLHLELSNFSYIPGSNICLYRDLHMVPNPAQVSLYSLQKRTSESSLLRKQFMPYNLDDDEGQYLIRKIYTYITRYETVERNGIILIRSTVTKNIFCFTVTHNCLYTHYIK